MATNASETIGISPVAVPAIRGLFGADISAIDDKGRLLIGKKSLRDRLGDPFVLTIGMTGCLVAYPVAKWDAVYSEMFVGRQVDPARDRYVRMVTATVDDEMSFDTQGRFVVPSRLRTMAGLIRDVYWIGCGEWLEIWDLEEWRAYEGLGESYAFQRVEQMQKAYEQMMGSR